MLLFWLWKVIRTAENVLCSFTNHLLLIIFRKSWRKAVTWHQVENVCTGNLLSHYYKGIKMDLNMLRQVYVELFQKVYGRTFLCVSWSIFAGIKHTLKQASPMQCLEECIFQQACFVHHSGESGELHLNNSSIYREETKPSRHIIHLFQFMRNVNADFFPCVH